MRWRRAIVAATVTVAGVVPALAAPQVAHAAAGVTGLVRNGVNQPVAGVSLQAFAASSRGIGAGLWTATSAADGTFQFGDATSFPIGSFTVTAVPPAGRGLGWARVPAVRGDGATIGVVVQPASGVRGTVSGPDGPLQGVTVSFGGPPHAVLFGPLDCPPIVVTAVTDAAGRYDLTDLGPVDCPLWFDPPVGSGLAAELWNDTADAQAATRIVLPNPATIITGRDAVLERAGTITGRITDPAGVPPAPDTFVNLGFPNGNPYSGFGAAAQTDANGNFVITDLKPGAYTLSHFGGGLATLRPPLPVTVTAGATTALGTLIAARLPVVTITDLAPKAMAKGSRVRLRITGTNFTPAAVVSVNVLEGGQVTATDTVVESPTLITTTVDLIPNPDYNHISVGVSNPDDSGTFCQACMDIVDGPDLPQTIAFETPPPAGAVAGTTFPVAARATTGLDVTLAATGACTGGGVNRITVSASAPGTCTVTATQAGNAAFAAAPSVGATTAVTAAGTPGTPGTPGPAAPTVVTATPTRLLDTRPDGPQTGYAGDKPAAGQTIELVVGGRGGVPADAGAVALNVTGTDATAVGFVTVWPCGQERPLASSLNLTPGVTSPNAVVTKLGDGGKVCLYTQSGAHLLADATGWFPAGSGYTAIRPERLLDTRPDGPITGYAGDKPAAGRTIELQVGGRGAVPSTAGTVVLNVTGTDPTTAGFVTVWPCGENRPLASSLNLSPGLTSPNAVITKLGAGGKVCVYTQSGAHLLADATGYTS